MNKKITSIVFVIAVSIVMASITTFLILWIFFYDYWFNVFVYQKNYDYGYFLTGNESFESFGERGKDMQVFMNELNNMDIEEKWGICDTTFDVLLLGDSNVWGQGIRNEDRFAYLLESKLSEEIDVDFNVLGGSGDSLLDNYVKYALVRDHAKGVDLVILTINGNDLLFTKNTPYNSDEYLDLLYSCGEEGLVMNPESYTDSEEYSEIAQSSTDADSVNYCVMKKIMDRFPSNTLVFDYGMDASYDHMLKYIEVQGFVVSVADLSSLREGEEFVSDIELHPSRAANRIFFKTIYDHLMSYYQ